MNALVPWVDWLDFCPICGHFKEIDTETSLMVASVMCFVCSSHFWRGYEHAVTEAPGPDPWDEYRREIKK